MIPLPVLFLAALAAEPQPANVTEAAPAAPTAEQQVQSVERAIAGGRLIQAETMLERPIPGAPEDELVRLRAMLALALQRNVQAESLFAGLVARHPDDCRPRSGLGIATLRLGDAARAEPMLDQAVRECPKQAEAWAALAVARDMQGKWASSADAFSTAILLDPENGAMLNNAGVSLMKQGRFADAIPFFRQALAIDPSDLRAANNLDIARVQAGERPSFGRESSITERAERLNNAGYAALLAGDEDAATNYFRDAIKLYPFRFQAAEANLKSASRPKGAQ